ncbi:MAG: hypothetical protein PHG13_00245 [Candidatus Pacebacteria bacterium]|jgi:alkylhydroperoxidase/carboxymuconolactone decarboxylase family protein YurZ|nr:hypothetical protein [Candidatus Paceibacterota bacterium]
MFFNNKKTTTFKSFRPKKEPLSDTQELKQAQLVLESALKGKNKRQLRFILSVAKLKAKGDEHYISNIKTLVEQAIKKGLTIEKIRMFCLHIFHSGKNAAERLINKVEERLKEVTYYAA